MLWVDLEEPHERSERIMIMKSTTCVNCIAASVRTAQFSRGGAHGEIAAADAGQVEARRTSTGARRKYLTDRESFEV